MMGKLKGNLLEELTHEQEMTAAGRERYLRRQEKQTLSLQTNAYKLITGAIERVRSHLSETIEAEMVKGSGRRFSWAEDIAAIDTELLSYIGLTVCMDAVGQNLTRNSTLVRIGSRIEMEIWAKGLREYDRKLAKRVETKATKDHDAARYRVKAVRVMAGKAGYVQQSWSDERRLKAAAPVFNSVLAVSDVFECWNQGSGKKTAIRVGLCEQASEALATMEYEASWHEPLFEPMLVEPRPWESTTCGCYFDEALAGAVPLIRKGTVQQDKTVMYQLKKQGRVPYMDALNAIQRTPFAINDYVLEAVEHCWETGAVFGKFPRKHHVEHHAKPDNWDALTPQQKKLWVNKSRAVRDLNRNVDGNRANMVQDLRVARKMAKYEMFYLPHNFDFRGRVYPVPHFNHHRDDHVKAMFLFANKKPITESGAAWVAFQVANTGDFDKISKKSLDDRLAWVAEHEDKIIQVGRDWQASMDWWTQADKPFQFLAACHEYANWKEHGDAYECGLPIALDGSNSGIQHYSAASLAKDDGALVNLTVSDVPQDIYQSVADRVRELLKTDTSLYSEMWQEWGVGRKTVKRNVMTFGYSSEVQGFSLQLQEDLMNPLRDSVTEGLLDVHPFDHEDDNGQRAARFLAEKNWQAVNEVIENAGTSMRFFQKLADALAVEGKHMMWHTPIGFPVVQRYRKQKTKKLKLFLHDREHHRLVRSQVSIRESLENSVARGKSKQAVAPNVIHSMDSCHLLITVNNGLINGVRDYFLIHDSFATVPADTWTMFDVVRQSFIAMYTDWCLFEDLYDTTHQLLTDPTRISSLKIPAKGDLDLKEVADSLYCFC
jgi:DNA-directed RNA polymerase